MRLNSILLIIMVTLITVLCFYPVFQQESTAINRPMVDLYNQLHNAQNWPKWNTRLKGRTDVKQIIQKDGFTIAAASENINVKFLNSFIFGVDDGRVTYDVVLLPQKYDNGTTIVIGFKSSLLVKLFPALKRQWLKKTILDDLKSYLENPSIYYGIAFEKQTIKDIDVMVCQKVIKPGDQFAEMKKSAARLRSLVPLKELANSDKFFLQITPSNKNLNMFVGVAVKRQLPSNQGLTYMHIPAQKALLVNYNGRYADRQKTYVAAEAYIHDHSLRSATPPIEVYNTLPLSDTSRVKTQIIFSAY